MMKNWLYATTVFFSAFLLFLLQPIIGKYLLPWLGGTPAVWTTCMLFFQFVLLLGYFYGYLLSRTKIAIQLFIHTTLILVVLLVVALTTKHWGQVMFYPFVSGELTTWHPMALLLFVLLVSVGFPYFLLSTTSTTVQSWFARTALNDSPYRLYALSNAGSFFALLLYPVLIEPHFTLKIQALFWTILFIIYAISYLLCLFSLMQKQSQKTTPLAAVAGKSSSVTPKSHFFFWVFYPLMTSVLLLAFTTQLTQGIASFPLLWLLPLALYLLSFVMAFSSRISYNRNVFSFLAIFLIIAVVYVLFNALITPAPMQIVVYNLAFLILSYFFHSELYALRPASEKLGVYYFLISLGGAMGGFLCVIIAPFIFNGYWELHLVVLGSLILVSYVLKSDPFSWVNLRGKKLSSTFLFMVVAYVTALLAIDYYVSCQHSVFMKRNFYGVLNVEKITSTNSSPTFYRLVHGHIIHGLQLATVEGQRQPTTYFGESSGAGMAFVNHAKRREPKPEFQALNVGVIGLGIGTLAVYGLPGDQLTFFEINPTVIYLANSDYFTFLKHCRAVVKIQLGDGRVSLSGVPSRSYDLLVVDAFSDDSIPIHLLTREAFSIYQSHLKNEDSILAIHITNKHLNLESVIAAQAADQHLSLKFIDSTAKGLFDFHSKWALMARTEQALDHGRLSIYPVYHQNTSSVVWTDDFSNILSIIKMKN